jgi:phosphate butyryltransferase
MKNFAELLEKVSRISGACVSVAAAHDPHVLEAVWMAKEAGIADFILIGDEEKIKAIAEDLQLDCSEFELIHEVDEEVACAIAVELVRSGHATALMKGLVDTSVIMKAVLNREKGIRTGKKLTHLAAFELSTYHKLLFVTDVAINIAPDVKAKEEIIKNAVEAVNNLGVTSPKVALLAANEKVNENMPVTLEYKELVENAKNGKITGCMIDGPLALDNAVSYESAKVKGIVSEVAGDADILMCPDIEAGNILYKALVFLAAAKSGGVVLGAKRPIVLTSRADSSESKLISIALSVLM